MILVWDKIQGQVNNEEVVLQ